MKYAELVQGIKSIGHHCDFYLVQVGSRKYVDVESFLPIKNILKLTTCSFFATLVDTAKIAITHLFFLDALAGISSTRVCSLCVCMCVCFD